MVQLSATIGQRGTMVLPKRVRDRYGLREGDYLIVEEREDGFFMRPARLTPRDVEEYTPARRAEFMLNNAVSRAEYEEARTRVQALGIDPDSVPHEPPRGD